MLSQIYNTIKYYNMLEAGDTVTVALSGGADSVCLLLALIELSKKLDINVSAIHVNHCLRGEESDRDEEFCRQLCKKYNIEFISGRFDVNGYAEKNKLSTEQAARDIRYDFFKNKAPGKKIATAHTANDNAETVIFNMARGTGIKGISGIPPVRDNIIRPLLEVTRVQIENFLAEKNQTFVTDSTNLTDDYTRNRIRHRVIPVLKEINPSLFNTVAAESRNLRRDEEYLNEQAEKAYSDCLIYKNELKELSKYHSVIRTRCIAKFLKENNIEINSKRISDIDRICISGGKINLKGDVYIISHSDTLKIEILSDHKSDDVYLPAVIGTSYFRHKKVIISIKEKDEKPAGIAIDADCICGNPVIRNRRPGDKIRFKGNNFTTSVKKFFNSRFELSERDDLCFLADDNGPFFIEKSGIADRVKITDKTVKIMDIIILCV